jgi:hypothetical protein
MVYIPAAVTTIGNYAFRYCYSLLIYCAASSKPSGWSSNWNYTGRPVIWGYVEKEYTYNFETNSTLEVEPIKSKRLVKLPDLVLEDKYFWGWYLNEDLSGDIYYPNALVHGSKLEDEGDQSFTFYARWENTSLGAGTSAATARPINEY